MNSTTKHIITLALAMLSLCHLAWGQKTVSNISAAQRSGTKLVDITYDLNYGTAQHVKVGLQVSSDGGTTWDVAAPSVSGDVGLNVASGTRKTMVWDAGADWNGQQAGNILYRITANDLDEMVFIPAGNFTMGDTFNEGEDNERPTRSVSISGFLIAKTEVTKAQWDEVYNWAVKVENGYTFTNTGEGKAENHPVKNVSWYDVVKWCNAKSVKEGLTPVYTVSGSTYKTGESTPAINYTANGYRLPTEAEWEKAARGGLDGKRFPWGDTIDHSHANYQANGSDYSYDVSPYTEDTYHPTYSGDSPVGSFSANGYGLFDMAGNLYEWCNDWYDSDYYGSSENTIDPTGPATGSSPVFRGGNLHNNAYYARCAHRGWGGTTVIGNLLGFRPARGQ